VAAFTEILAYNPEYAESPGFGSPAVESSIKMNVVLFLALGLAAIPAWAELYRPILTLGKANLRPFSGGISMSLSSDGKLVAAGTVEGDVIILNARNQRTLRTFRAHDRHAQVLFLSDGSLVTSGRDGTILLWNPKNARLIRTGLLQSEWVIFA
jgi:WD40 repeat protein